MLYEYNWPNWIWLLLNLACLGISLVMVDFVDFYSSWSEHLVRAKAAWCCQGQKQITWLSSKFLYQHCQGSSTVFNFSQVYHARTYFFLIHFPELQNFYANIDSWDICQLGCHEQAMIDRDIDQQKYMLFFVKKSWVWNRFWWEPSYFFSGLSCFQSMLLWAIRTKIHVSRACNGLLM
jgi:hypothetical protein